jgi:hypothetical protein
MQGRGSGDRLIGTILLERNDERDIRHNRLLTSAQMLAASPATGITAYLKNGGTLERAATMANHASTRTTQLYDRRSDDITLDEVERVLI